MPAEPSRESLDTDRLSTYLKALSNPRRLDLLRLLRVPRASADIVLSPKRRDDGLSPTRPMSRQSIEEHLASLEEVGVVDRLPDEPGRANHRVLNQARLFAVLEELRELTALRPSVRVDVDATMAAHDAPALSWPSGPKLVLVSGPWEGRTFPLAGEGPWRLGRVEGSDVALSYDPYVSSRHARLVRHEGGFALEAEAEARNPARVNFQPLRPGQPRALRSGDVLGVGRSLLVLQER